MSKFTVLDDIPSGINPAAVRIIKARGERTLLIEDGMLPRTTELFSGYPFAGRNIDQDIMGWCRSRLLLGGSKRLVAALENLAVSHTPEACWLVIDADDGELQDDLDRVLLYATCMGDHKAADRLLTDLRLRVALSHPGSFNSLIFRMLTDGFSTMCKSPDEAFERGYKRMRDMTAIAGDLFTAQAWIAAGSPAEAEVNASADELIREALEAEAEDRAETAAPTLPGIVVVPQLQPGATSHKRDIQRLWTGIDGEPIPLVARGDITVARNSLVARWPHAEDVIDTILGDLVVRDTITFRPTCLVGKPGSGKTALTRAIAKTLGVPFEIVSMGGVSDSSLMGTSAQWNSVRESVPLQLIRRSGVANPGLCWDEIEKVGTSSHNGNALDALLPMFERTHSRKVRDLALEVEVDLSYVSHFATANSVAGVPAPLRDRMRILHMPDPSWRHIGPLAQNIVLDLMFSRGVDPRWMSPLAPDEIAIIKRSWPGGSLRTLTRIVEKFVDGREMTWGRA